MEGQRQAESENRKRRRRWKKKRTRVRRRRRRIEAEAVSIEVIKECCVAVMESDTQLSLATPSASITCCEERDEEEGLALRVAR